MDKKTTGVALATAAAALFSFGAALSVPAYAATDAGVHCVGANTCKGTSECKSATNACKGQNSCKGQGWITKADAAACKAAGGTVAK